MKEETKFFSSSQGREKGRMKSDIVQKYGESVILEKLHMELDFFFPLFFCTAWDLSTHPKNWTVLPAVEAQSCN